MNESFLKNLEDLAYKLKNTEDENLAKKILIETSKKLNIKIEDLQEFLATDYNCYMCSKCGRYFGEDELSSNDEDCIFCYED